ncbi:hypothetical protein J3R83DRAFT_5844 [Lanmaoa asiatica]|nr:hypothetical protein J3R83DRAFT_5844 [Lanmaoa asiatica]
MRSPRPTSVASYQNSSPRLPSPLNPSPNSFSPPLPSGHTPRNSPVGELSDTLSPLRERLDSGFSTSPRSSPGVARPRTSSFSRSPERPPVTSPIPLQPHRTYARHPSPSSSPFAQGIPFPSSSPLLTSSPLAGPSQFSMSQSPRPLSSSSNSPRQGSPASIHSTRSQSQSRPLRSPHQPTQSHFHLSQSSPVQIIPSPSRYPCTQSLIQQSFGNTYAAQAASSPSDDPCNRRLSLGAESHPHPSTQGSGPALVGHPFVEDMSTAKGDSTPLNEAPIRWWGGRRGWVDDWDNVVQQSQACNPYAVNISGRGELDDATGAQPGYRSPLAFREPFRRGGVSPGAFLDEEIRASFDGVGGVCVAFADPLTPSLAHAPMGANVGYEMEGVPVPRIVPMHMAPGGTGSRIQNDSLGYGEVGVGPPPVEGGFVVQKTPDNSTLRHSYHVKSHGNTSEFIPDGAMSAQGQVPKHGGLGHEHVGGRSRRPSDASTHSLTSYASCMSGPLQSQSQSHTSTCPSLCSLGIGIEEAEREGRRLRTFWGRRNSGSTMKRQSKDLSHGTGGHSEDVDQGCWSSHFLRNSEKSGLAHAGGLEGERDVKTGEAVERDADSKQSAARTHEKDTVKHGSLFFRVGSKHGDVSGEQAQRDGYNRAERVCLFRGCILSVTEERGLQCVSLAITSILPATTITMLSPVGEALVRARESAKFVGHELAPVVKDTLSVSADILSLAPVPGLEEAAKALLSVWDACQKVDVSACGFGTAYILLLMLCCKKTNRLSCLRLAERCATLLYSVRCEIDEAGVETALALAEPVERLCGALAQVHRGGLGMFFSCSTAVVFQIRTFLETQLHRPFLKRYVRREEIARELTACNEAITDAASRFGISVQIRTYHAVCSAASESRRFAQEAQALLSLDHQIIQRHYTYAMIYGQEVPMWREQVAAEFSGENALGLTMDGAPVRMNGDPGGALGEDGGGGGGGDGGEGYLTPPPAYGPPLQPPPPTIIGPVSATGKLLSTGPGSGSIQNTPTSSMLSTGYPSHTTDPTVSAPPTPTPTRATFIVEETKTRTTRMTTTKAENMLSHPTSPMRALVEVHRAQDSVDAAADEAALQGTLAGALGVHNDVEMVRCLQVARGEIPEAAETLRRMLGAGMEAEVNENERVALEGGEHDVDTGNTELDRKFMQSGIEAMTRLTSVVAKQPQGEQEQVGLDEGIGTIGALELPSWTITRYEVIRTRKIGVGFLSDVYLGHWRRRPVVIKVLAHSVSREAFVRHMELWNALDHPNVLPLFGASSAVGEKPWFFVSKFCSGDNLVASLKRARAVGAMMVGNETAVRVDLLRCMHEIAKGMAYLHGRGVLHGDLRAANVLVDENGRCVLSDFGQYEIQSEAHQSCGQPESREWLMGLGLHVWKLTSPFFLDPIRWRAPEMLMGDDRPTNAADVYAFAMCCVEILGMGDLPWTTLDDKAIRELVLDQDRRPPIPVLAGYAEVANAVVNLVHSCWVREPDRRPSFASVSSSLEGVWRLQGHDSPQIRHASTPLIDIGSALVMSTESSPADDQYETASESMTTDTEEENMDRMIDVPLTSPGPAIGNGNAAHYAVHVNVSNHMKVLTQVSSGVLEDQDKDTPTPSPTKYLNVDARNEENYRLIVGSNHAFHNSLTLPLWSPTRVELGAVGYLSKPKGEFITLFNAIDPLQSCEERVRCLPSVHGYGKFEVQKREDGKRSVAQRGLDAISVFLTFKTRGDRSQPYAERIARQYAIPLVHGKPSAHLTTYDLVQAARGPHYGSLFVVPDMCSSYAVVGTLDAPDWALFASDDHSDGRAQFNAFAGREKGEPWGMYTMERAVKSGNAGPGRWVDVGQGTFASKVSCITAGGHDVAGDTVMLAGLRFERGMQAPVM